MYPSGSETLIYHEVRFERGHAIVIADKVTCFIVCLNFFLKKKKKDGLNHNHGILELVTPVEIVIKPKNGGSNVSIELSKLRDGSVTLLKP